MTKARRVALETLMKVFDQQSYSNLSLNQAFQKQPLSKVDQNLATNLVYGTIQHKLYLAYQLHDLIKTPLKEAYLKPLLLMSAYQIFFLDKIPNRAVLDQANVLAKSFGKNHSAGFRVINGILRALLRRGEQLPDSKKTLQYLSVTMSMPEWLVSYLITTFCYERAKSLMASCQSAPHNSVRLNVPRTQYEQLKKQLETLGFQSEPSKLTPHNLVLNHGGIVHTPLFQNGQLTIQDEAASLAADAFDLKGDETILDACSAPGGKTAQLAARLTTGSVMALDLHENKLKLVHKNAQRMQVDDRVQTKAMDARDCNQYFSEKQFDRILVDAPCTGLGLLRRKPEIRYTKTLADIHNLARIQGELLDALAPLLKPNGQLVYSTCTITVQEDEEVVAHFLRTHPEFELVPILLPKIQSKGALKIFPDTFDTDGFFIAKMILRG